MFTPDWSHVVIHLCTSTHSFKGLWRGSTGTRINYISRWRGLWGNNRMTLICASEEFHIKRCSICMNLGGVCLECSSDQMEFRNDVVIRDLWDYESIGVLLYFLDLSIFHTRLNQNYCVQYREWLVIHRESTVHWQFICIWSLSPK